MKQLTIFICWLALMAPAFAAPGAHGPNGEHLDGPAAVANTGSVPRIEAFTELFELVGHLSGGELSVMVDRYDSNEPVLNGKLEVQYKGVKAPAKFHADLGDYAIDDPKLLQALSAPGKHQLIFTFVAGGESDLIEGTLEVQPAAAHDHAEVPRWAYWTGAGALLLLAGILFARRRVTSMKR